MRTITLGWRYGSAYLQSCLSCPLLTLSHRSQGVETCTLARLEYVKRVEDRLLERAHSKFQHLV